MLNLRSFSSAFALALVAFGATPALAETVGDLSLRMNDQRGQGSLAFQVPFADTDSARTFFDVRGSVDSTGAREGNIGLAHRFLAGQMDAQDMVLGAYAFYDYRETAFENSFEQVTVGADLATGRFALRANYYHPLDDAKDAGESFLTGDVFLSGNNIAAPRFQRQEIALKGYDAEISANVARILDLDLTLSAGYFSFKEDFAPDVEGFKGRIELVSDNDWSFGAEMRDDDVYGTRVTAVLRARMDFAATGGKGRGGTKRLLASYVDRDLDVVTVGPDKATPRRAGSVPLTIDATGTASVAASATRIHFVKEGTAGTGTFEAPFNSVAAAATAAATGDMIYVHTGAYAGNVTLKNDQRLIGQGDALTVSFQGKTSTLIAAGTRPTLTAPSGNVVTLANNNQISGLKITASAGTGAANRDQNAAIYGTNATIGRIANNDFTGNVGTGGTSSVGIRLDTMAGIANTRSETRHFVSNSTILPYHATYDPDTTSAGLGNSEIISFSNASTAGTWGAITLGAVNKVDIVRIGEGDLAGVPLLQRRDDIAAGIVSSLGAAANGGITTVSMDPQGRFYAVAVPHSDDMTKGQVEIRNRATGAVMQRLTVGIGPDGTAISPDARWLVVANEAEDPVAPGSVSVIDLTNVMTGAATHTLVDLTDQTGNFFNNVAGPGKAVIEMDVDGQPRTAVTHTPAGLQPEYVAFSPDSRYAFISMQENNGAMVIDLGTGQPANIKYFNLGTSTGTSDISDTNPPVYNFTGAITNFLREPDGIAAFTTGGQLYFITADEGDNRNNFGGTRLRGGRSVSIFNGTTGALVGTTGPTLDAALFAAANSAMAANPAIYGTRNDGTAPHYYPEGRSDRGGVEPEVLTTFTQGTKVYSLVGLERGASVMLVDITNPAAPTPVSFGLLPRDMTGVDGFDLTANSEGIATLLLGDQRYGYAGLEDNGRIAVWRVNAGN